MHGCNVIMQHAKQTVYMIFKLLVFIPVESVATARQTNKFVFAERFANKCLPKCY